MNPPRGVDPLTPEDRRERILRYLGEDFALERGQAMPLGATVRRGGVNFAVVSRHATEITLVLFAPGDGEPLLELPLDARYHRTGDVWHAFVRGMDAGLEYGYRAARQPNPEPWLHRYDRAAVLVDPFARALAGAERWGEPTVTAAGPAPLQRSFRSRVVDDRFDWGWDSPPDVPLADSVIYELCVRGFTSHPGSGVAAPGTFRGLVEKVPYLAQLGVTAVELMPITEWDELDLDRKDPATGQSLRNLWGYQPLGFFAPKAALSATGPAGGVVREFKETVKAFHEAGIEVLLDMVCNHTGEDVEWGPSISFRGLDNAIYYIVDPITGAYHDYTGCGNTLNCNHPAMRGLILASLRYWVTEMHVDGFRFDLASVLGRGRDGSVLANPPLLEMIAADPVLARCKLIAEAWDAAGLYQVGSFPSWGRWAEWNGRFRDDVRRFVRGDAGTVPQLATRIAGSADLYRSSGRAPYHSVNFVTSHDGLTLADLVSYEHKRNEANGEGNLDGVGDDLAWGCGVDGPTEDPAVLALRARQQRNFLAILMLSQGVPMLTAGDELGRTQGGNNNAYCQDNPTGWIDWRLMDQSAALVRYVTRLVRFRKAHSNLRRRTFFDEDDPESPGIEWHGPVHGRPDWSDASRSLAFHLLGQGRDDDLYVALNAGEKALPFELPSSGRGRAWHRFLDTSLEPPDEISDLGDETVLADGVYLVGPRSVVVLVGRQTR